MKEHWLCRFLYWLKKKFVVDEKYGLDLSLDEYIELDKWWDDQIKQWRERAKEKEVKLWKQVRR